MLKIVYVNVVRFNKKNALRNRQIFVFHSIEIDIILQGCPFSTAEVNQRNNTFKIGTDFLHSIRTRFDGK